MSLKQKKGVSKEELRRLMKQQKSDKTITHPLAKYPFIAFVTRAISLTAR